jgi:predicted GNAT family acetyltransferase/glutaredoxin
MLTLYQAEWCPFSSAVREVLTEFGLDFVARQVEPWPDQRATLRAVSGSDRIPALQTEDGRFFSGTRAIYGYLRALDAWDHAAEHRRRFRDHEDARESDAVGQLVEYFRPKDDVEGVVSPDELTVVDVPEESRYELRLGDRMIGEAAYHRRQGTNRIAFTHTEVDESVEGRGLGSRLVAAALEDVRRKGLVVVPLCPFIAHYMATHPEVHDLLAESHRDRVTAATN